MKKIIICLGLLLAVVNIYAQNLVNNPEFKNHFEGYWKNKFSKYTVKDGILNISGSPEAGEKENHSLLMTGLLLGPPAGYSEKTYILSFSVKTGMVSGSFMAAVREASEKNYAKLHQIRIGKWDANTDWKICTLKFTCRKNVKEMRLNFLAQGLSDKDLIQIKDIKVSEAD